MKYIEKLLQGTKVEWKKLGEVAEIKRGRVISKGYLNENAGLYPVYSSQTENMGEIGRIRTFDFDQESITWTTDGAKAGTVFHRKGRFSITNVCGLIKIRDIQSIGYRYLYYWLSIEAKKHVYLGMGNPKLMSNQMERVPIPIPPLHVQQEIARILDKFTELETELEAKLETELALRKQQYERYRDQLLSPDKGLSEIEVEWKKLGEVAEIGTGSSNRQDEVEQGEYPFYVRSKNVLHSTTYQFDETAIIIPGEGGIGDIYHYAEGKYALHQRAYRIHLIEGRLLDKFLFYFMGACFKRYIISKSVVATTTSIRKPMLEQFPIPIPPLHVQQRIVSVLDKFHTLTTSISEGLPREIELRKQQYKYYRDKLLSFSNENRTII